MQAVMIANVIWYTMKTCMLRGSSHSVGQDKCNFKVTVSGMVGARELMVETPIRFGDI